MVKQRLANVSGVSPGCTPLAADLPGMPIRDTSAYQGRELTSDYLDCNSQKEAGDRRVHSILRNYSLGKDEASLENGKIVSLLVTCCHTVDCGKTVSNPNV